MVVGHRAVDGDYADDEAEENVFRPVNNFNLTVELDLPVKVD